MDFVFHMWSALHAGQMIFHILQLAFLQQMAVQLATQLYRTAALRLFQPMMGQGHTMDDGYKECWVAAKLTSRMMVTSSLHAASPSTSHPGNSPEKRLFENVKSARSHLSAEPDLAGRGVGSQQHHLAERYLSWLQNWKRLQASLGRQPV